MDASPLPSWPAPLRAFIHETYGDPTEVERLGGMGGGSVHRARFADGSVIVKASPGNKEFNFYRSVAPSLSQLGIAIPQLEWSAQISGAFWLILEDVPCPLPEGDHEHWTADHRVVTALSRLHSATFNDPIEMPGLFEPGWTDDMTKGALSLFPSSAANTLAPVLAALQTEAQPLFEPRCSISGDPNPANWGVRHNGTAVLFDWERFGRGTPALDLAIIVPGLGDDSAFATLARDYSDEWQRACTTLPWPWSIQELSHGISLAKAWVAVEFLANHATDGASATARIANWLVEVLPAWINDSFE